MKKRGDPLIGEMDTFAGELLTSAKTDKDVTLQAKIDVFRTISGWIGVKNRLVDDSEGGDLDAIRTKLREGEADSGAPGRKRSPAKWAGFPTGGGGAALDAIKRKLPRADNGDAGDDRPRVERAHPGAGGIAGGIHPGADRSNGPDKP